jgi:hypothetical protein
MTDSSARIDNNVFRGGSGFARDNHPTSERHLVSYAYPAGNEPKVRVTQQMHVSLELLEYFSVEGRVVVRGMP